MPPLLFHEIAAQSNHFQTLEEVFSVAEYKKVAVKELVKAFAEANIPLENVNALSVENCTKCIKFATYKLIIH